MRLPYKTEKCYYEGLKDISPNAWRVFLSVEVLYDAMSDGARRLTVEEFFNCYHPAEITQSKAMYNFAPRSPLLRLICENPDSNKDWKNRYFFFEGDGWMFHPGDIEFIPVDKTWGIMPPSGMHPSANICLYFNYSAMLNYPSFYAARDCPPISIEQFSFLENIFNKTKLEERTWAKLVNLNTLHWYCDGPKPTKAALWYKAQVQAHKSITFSFLSCLFQSSMSILYFFLQKWMLLREESSSSKTQQKRKRLKANLRRRVHLIRQRESLRRSRVVNLRNPK